MDKILAKSVQEGVGTDNMTCIFIRFKDVMNGVISKEVIGMKTINDGKTETDIPSPQSDI